ncbi:methylated-DNA--[protein]-cysteine S-methyltransferase [Demequina aurantiaca]|uniref:methylated-DNA--[protein]-cysteine S-methyltransferase n=1 Tax=Demequina aurantiaca TaxID=676200 RepID=UPI003D3522CC
MYAYESVDTPDGPFIVVERDDGVVVAAGWSADPEAVAERAGIEPGAALPDSLASADAVRAWYAGAPLALDGVAVEQSGTVFQSAVWHALRQIPAGQVRRYGEVATELGSPGASRAVGAACGRNAVALFVPCHRVVGASGKLTGFAWGVDVKRSLLEREDVATAL